MLTLLYGKNMASLSIDYRIIIMKTSQFIGKSIRIMENKIYNHY